MQWCYSVLNQYHFLRQCIWKLWILHRITNVHRLYSISSGVLLFVLLWHFHDVHILICCQDTAHSLLQLMQMRHKHIPRYLKLPCFLGAIYTFCITGLTGNRNECSSEESASVECFSRSFQMFFTMWYYASAVYVIVVCLSLCVSDTLRCCIKTLLLPQQGIVAFYRLL